MYEEDERRLYESFHDLGASEDVSAVIGERPWQQTLRSARRTLAQAREALRVAATAASVEASETDTARASSKMKRNARSRTCCSGSRRTAARWLKKKTS